MVESKRKSRQLVFECLYEADFNGDISKNNLGRIFQRSLSLEYCTNPLTQGQVEYAEFLLQTITKKFDFLKSYIDLFSKNNNFKTLPFIDRNILLVALAEIFYSKEYDIPVHFILEEASSLGNMYSSGKAMGLINTLLKKILKESQIQSSKKKDAKKHYISGIVYAEKAGELYYLLVKDFSNKWRIVRTINDNNDALPIPFFIDKVKSLAGVDTEIENDHFAYYSYCLHVPEEGRVKVDSSVVVLKAKGTTDVNISKEADSFHYAEWFKATDIKALHMYSDVKKFVLTHMDEKVERMKQSE